MTTRLTPEREREIREREARATPDWRQGTVEKDAVFVPNDDLCIGGEAVILRMNEHFPNYANDCAFIAHARADVPDLLAEIDALRRERDEAREQRDRNGVLLEIAQETTRIAQRGRDRSERLTGLDNGADPYALFNAAAGEPKP